jgi:hypothetical protein
VPDEPSGAPGEREREHLAATLGAHYAAGHLELGELDRRLERLLSATSMAAAAAVLEGLPALEDRAPPRRRWRVGRHGESKQPQPGWIPTLERFRDPGSERLMRVWIDPADGRRHYLAE